MTPFEEDVKRKLKGKSTAECLPILVEEIGLWFYRYGQQQRDDRQSCQRRHGQDEA